MMVDYTDFEEERLREKKGKMLKLLPFNDYLFNTLVHSSPRLPLYSKERWV